MDKMLNRLRCLINENLWEIYNINWCRTFPDFSSTRILHFAMSFCHGWDWYLLMYVVYTTRYLYIRNVDLYILLRSICMNLWCMYAFTNADRPTYASVGFVTLLTIQSRLSISSPWALQDVEAQNSGSKFWVTNIEMWWLSSRIICFKKGLYFRMRY